MKAIAVVILITLGLVGCSTTTLHTAEPVQKQPLTKQPETSYGKVKPDVSYTFQYQKEMTHMHAWGGPEYAASVEYPEAPCNKCWCSALLGDNVSCCVDPSFSIPCPDRSKCIE